MRPKSSRLTPTNLTKKSRGLIRSLNRALTRDDKSPRVVRKTAQPIEPTVCARCGAVYLRKTWRHDHKLTEEMLEQRHWGFCPACDQMSQLEAQGRLIIHGAAAAANRDLIRTRIENVASYGMKTQPERRIVSIDTIEADGEAIEVLTTSQKLTHRLAHELKKLFGGRTSYNWSDDGTLYATWQLDQLKGRKTKKSAARTKKPAAKQAAGRGRSRM
jgi:NMD protein affecting ribosome stability and mRNA decay